MKENKCECCGCSEWNGKPLTMELHHKDGNHYNNEINNLQMLCPNCHAQTENYRGKNKGNETHGESYKKTRKFLAKIEEKECPVCGKTFMPQRNSQKYCSRECYNKIKKEDNNIFSKELLLNTIDKFNNLTEMADYLNTNRTTLRKYLKKYDLYEKIKCKYDFHAKKVNQCDLNGNLIKTWGSIKDAQETLKISEISKCCELKRRTAGGFIWRYVEE